MEMEIKMFEFEGQEMRFNNDYAQFDRMSDVNESLDAFILAVERAIDSDLAWKHAVISVHSALQGIICVSLKQGNSFATWKPKDFKKWMKAYEKGDENYPIPYLDYFMELYDKLFLRNSEIERSDIERLNSTRNNLTHFNTDIFSVCLHSTFLCCWEALKAIKLAPKIPQLNYIGADELSEFTSRVQKSKKVMRKYLKEKAV